MKPNLLDLTQGQQSLVTQAPGGGALPELHRTLCLTLFALVLLACVASVQAETESGFAQKTITKQPASSLVAGIEAAQPPISAPLTAEELQQYRDLSKRIKENYVDAVDDKQLFNACLSGMGKLDDHSDYYDAEAYKDLTGNSGSAGVGLELEIRNHRATVISAIEDTPASQAGIRKGDSLFKIDGNIVIDLSLDKVVRQLRGKPGTKLRLTVKRDGTPEPLTFELTRKEIKVQTVKSRMLEPGYGYIRLSSFASSTIEKFVEALQAMDKQSEGNLNGLVLDLRNNPGGRLDNALALAAAFLPRDATLMSTQGRAAEATRTFKYDDHDLNLKDSESLLQLPVMLHRIRLVVLVNNGTAAGAEIIVGALQDYRRALIVGTPTFGKDSLQTLMTMSLEGAKDETALKLTTARWQTPNGRSSAPAGIAPDIIVASTENDALQERDKALERALVSLKSGQASTNSPQQTTERQAAVDALRKDAYIASEAHKNDKSIELWSQLLKDQPDDVQALRLRGVLYAEQGKRELATTDHLRAIELEPNAASTWSSVCWGKILLGDFVDAQPDCAKGVALDPDNLTAVFNLGHTWLLRGDKDTAWSWYEKSLLLIENKEELADLLADFDLFKKNGWQPKLSLAGYDWFSKQGKAWLARRAAADGLIAKIRAAVAAKDTATELKLRIERLNELEKLLPASHPVVINAANALADTFMQAKQPDKALPLYLRTIDYLQGLDGNPPRGLITTINKITEAVNAKEFTGKAAPALEQMLVVMEKFWGPDNPDTQSLVRRLATEYVEENPMSSLDLGRRALAYLEQKNAPVEKQINTIYTILAVLEKQYLHAESALYLEKILVLLNQHKEENLKSIIQVNEFLAGTHALLDHPDQSLSYYKQVLELRRGPNDDVLNEPYFSILIKISKMLYHFGRTDAAHTYLEEAMQLAEKLYGKDSPTLLQITKIRDEQKNKPENPDKPVTSKVP